VPGRAEVTETYEIGPLLLDAETCVLTQSGVPLALGKRAVAVLAVLVRSAPQYVPKTRIMEAAWAGVVVEESNLAVQISSIRRALAEVSGDERWLETLARRGYRFVGPVTALPLKIPSASGGANSRSNLPQPLTSFVGRERELAELQKLLAHNRLLTLTGTGGVGKTRLAMCIAAAELNDYSNGVRLVELGALRDPDLVPQAVLTALELQEQPGKQLTQTLTEYLGARHLLLVLDNAEHLLAACAQFTDTVLRKCPKVTVLATSRERLGVPGELTFRVPSLSIPDLERGATAQSLAQYESVRLFNERAQRHLPRFALTDQNAPALASICRRLDGIALAIELAAARVRSMSVEEVNERLDRGFGLLTGDARTVPPRQQTLRAAIDWSYDLLSEAEKALFCATSVFAGGFTLEAAESVCAGDDIETRDVLDLLTSLTDKSLVVAEERAAATRYRLLQTMHQYATERLRELGNEADRHRRHLAHFLALAEAAEPQLTGKDQLTWLDRLEAEHDNLRSALARSNVTGGDGEAGLRLASALARFWLVRGYLAEGRGWLTRLLAATRGADMPIRAKALNWAGALAWKQGDYTAAHALYEQALTIRRERGDRRGIGAVLNNQGLLAYEQGNYGAARALHEQSLAIDRELGDRWGIAVSLIHLGSLAMMQGDYAAARALNEESLAIFREFGDRGHIANAIRSLGTLCSQQGDHAAARALYDESLAICRDLGDRSGIARALYGLGVTARHEGDNLAAASLLEESLAIYRELGDREGSANALTNLGQVAATRGDYSSARVLQEESLGIYRELGDRSGIAGSMEALAGIAFALGDPRRAACMWGGMERLREEIGAPRVPSERGPYDENVTAASAALGDIAAFDLAWQRGRAMMLEQAIAFALNATGP
jgi:predicted ATPase/DNA-binding winged helix-turn-helix (wHTH) protein/Tfp pilus assembly protein PilF